jgi:2-desacetyl-2-hydroxyethyl bacteriochlorophyllide A dehydrogenase
MKATVFTGPQQLDVREIDIPSPGPKQVLVRTSAVGICTLEQRYFKGVSLESYPFLGGHEVSGVVVEVGSEAATVARPGDIVTLALLARCGSCYYCRRGMDNQCLNNRAAHAGAIPGPAGLSEYVLAEDYQVYRPDLQDHDAATLAQLALAEPVACVVRSAQRPPLQFGDMAIVQGAGIMGLLHTQLLRKRGARVLVAEPDATRRQMAMRAGADWIVDPLRDDLPGFVRERTGGRGANAVFFTAGGLPAIEQAVQSLAKGGWLCLYGSVSPKGSLALDPNLIHYNELVVTGTFSHTRNSFEQAVSLIATQQIDVSDYVSETVQFARIRYALERATSADTYRVVVTFGG